MNIARWIARAANLRPNIRPLLSGAEFKELIGNLRAIAPRSRVIFRTPAALRQGSALRFSCPIILITLSRFAAHGTPVLPLCQSIRSSIRKKWNSCWATAVRNCLSQRPTWPRRSAQFRSRGSLSPTHPTVSCHQDGFRRNGRSLDRRSRMDLLYQRHDRASQRGNAVISQLDCADTCLFCRRRSRYRRKRGPPRGADVARVGAIWPSVSRKRRIVDPT